MTGLYAVCGPWLDFLGVWPMKRFSWLLRSYLTLSVVYLLVPEVVYLYRNYENVELFGSCFCELMVVCQGLYKLLILIYYKPNWQIVIADIVAVFDECGGGSLMDLTVFLLFYKRNPFLQSLILPSRIAGGSSGCSSLSGFT